MSTGPYYAHTPPDHDPTRWQTMLDHSTNVADMAADFAEPFGASEIARLAGWLHDVGKYSDEFQQYLKDCHKAKLAGTPPPKAGAAEHKSAGAKLALDSMPQSLREMLSLCVIGHHGELTAKSDVASKVAENERRNPSMGNAIDTARQELAALKVPPPPLTIDAIRSIIELDSGAEDRKGTLLLRMEMLTRLVFSALVDADSLDTEAHFTPSKSAMRHQPCLADMLDRWLICLTDHVVKRQAKADNRPVNRVRREVYEACLQSALNSPGFFTLTVPTGGGKTLSSLAFSLKHAASNEMLRVIYAIPYTSIIDQTAATFRDVLGSEGILEHHSAVDPPAVTGNLALDQAELSEDFARRLAAENWDAPLVVTTNVQLFESLFACGTSRCRKLHNIARSVIVLDEVQTLPMNLLVPLVDGLRTLVENFGCTVVLCTATQPAIAQETSVLKGIGPVTHIIQHPAPHFQDLKRVTFRIEKSPCEWSDVASWMRGTNKSCLCVTNTKKDALALVDALGRGPDVLHLSTLMCGAHRRDVLDAMQKILADERAGIGVPVMLATTQVIEAGVDIDFPNAMRAIASIDRIIQTAGRCNREGNQVFTESTVVVFEPVSGSSPPGEYRTALEEASNLIKASGGSLNFDSPEVATQFFARLYQLFGSYLDKDNVQKDRKALDYPEVAKKVRLIKDNTIPVLVRYELRRAEFDDIVARIRGRIARKQGMTRDLWREIQPLTVAIYTHEVAKHSAVLSELVPEQLLLWSGRYDPLTGIGGVVALDTSDLIV